MDPAAATPEEPVFRGVHVTVQGQLRISELSIDPVRGPLIGRIELRTDMWPH